MAKKGYKQTKEHIQKRTAVIKKIKIEKYGNAFGPTAGWNKGLTKETDVRVNKYAKKLSITVKGRLNKTWKGKKLEDIVGFKKAQELKTKKSEMRKNKNYAQLYGEIRSKEIREKQSLSLQKTCSSSKIRQKRRQLAVERVLLGNGNFPNYNLKACEFFKAFDEQNNTKGRYAVYGNGEYYIEELGYWPDYINFDKKLIMEYDESHHFDNNDNLKEKDVIRQKEIQKFYPNFKFKRIKNPLIYGKAV